MKEPDTKLDKGASDKFSQGYGPAHGDIAVRGSHLKREGDVDIEITSGMEKRSRQTVEETEDLVRRAKEATDAVDYLVNHYKQSWADFEDFIKGSVRELRQYKMALEVETRQTLNAFKDVRNFFFDDKHEEEVARLREFVDLCQRLEKLKESGFLDTVADTMLRLATKKEEEWQWPAESFSVPSAGEVSGSSLVIPPRFPEIFSATPVSAYSISLSIHPYDYCHSQRY
jgi:hypothetical protein